MADLLSSSSDEDEAPASAGVWRSIRVPSGNDRATADVVATATELLTPVVAKPRDGPSCAPNNPLRKPVISARELLKQFLPTRAKTSTPSTSPPRVGSYLEPAASKPAMSPSRSVECTVRKERPPNREPPTQAKASSTVNANAQRDEASAVASSVYVSPFGRENDPQLKRRRSSMLEDSTWKAQKQDNKYRRQSLSNGSAKSRINSSDAAINTSSTVVDDDDDWFSDAKETEESKTKQAQASCPEQPRLQALSSRKQKRSRSDSESSLPDEDRWPRLPPRDTNEGPLVLSESPHCVQVCANINNYLFDYQREGVRFMYDAYARGSGAILGDDMGLGKTIQVIALLAAIMQKQGDARDKDTWRKIRKERRAIQFEAEGEDVQTFHSLDGSAAPILIVVPASLLHNWESEINIWMSCCTVLLHGKPEERENIIYRSLRGDYEIVICSYDIFKSSVDRLGDFRWEVIILDEMHCLKNPESKLTRAVQGLRCPRKLGLTGTLMQNNEKELHCLLHTIAPGALGSWQEFRTYYGDDIKFGRKKSAAPEAIERSRKKERKLRQVLVPYYLRREKDKNPRFEDIKKRDQVVFCELTPYQKAAYERILAMPEFELLRRGDEICDCGRESRRKRKVCCYRTPASLGEARGLLWDRFHPSGEACKSCPNCMGLVCVAQLLKLSNHMELLKVNPHDSPDLQEYGAEFAEQAFGEDVDAVGGVEQVTTFREIQSIGTKTCGKMLVLGKLLAFWQRKRQKTLVFSRSTRMLDILQLYLIGEAISYDRLDGQTKVDERLQLVNKFNDPESTIGVFLISTKAGGMGLNLPSATNVVLFDPSWNPAHDCQAQDRAYRIGQTKDVQVYRLITLGTIEEMIYVRQIYKQQLSDTTLKGVAAPRYFEGVQGDSRQQGELFGIRNLLCWNEGGVLKGIQDAYKRDKNGLMIQENQVQLDALAHRTRKTQKPPRQQKLEEEMVEVANEMVTEILSPEDTCAASMSPEEPSGNVPTSPTSDGSTERCFFEGARTLMHEAIVGEHENRSLDSHSCESDSEDYEQPENEVHVRKQPHMSSGLNKSRHPSITNGNLPPRKRVHKEPSRSQKPADRKPSDARNRLYIPTYL